MQWVLSLETEKDSIALCRLINILRRKSINFESITITAGAATYEFSALVDTAENEVAHIFHFFRRTEGVSHVTCSRLESATDAASPASTGTIFAPNRLPEASSVLHSSKPANPGSSYSHDRGLVSETSFAPAGAALVLSAD
jgi:hypothetical protein